MMKDGSWQNLCKATREEGDPRKLLELLRQINRELGESIKKDEMRVNDERCAARA
jgi:hypothetical protein